MYLLLVNLTLHNVSLLVYNVNASSQHESKTFKLLHLSPGQEYEVRIRAVTAAGPGANTTAKFKTKHHEDFGITSHLNYFLVECDKLRMSCMTNIRVFF